MLLETRVCILESANDWCGRLSLQLLLGDVTKRIKGLTFVTLIYIPLSTYLFGLLKNININ